MNWKTAAWSAAGLALLLGALNKHGAATVLGLIFVVIAIFLVLKLEDKSAECARLEADLDELKKKNETDV